MTPFIKKKEIKKDWYIINAQNAAVGRLAAYISKVLRGKNKATYNPHMDNGDFVVVTNIDKIRFTGKKFTNKKYFKHTGHPGGIKESTPSFLKEKNKYLCKFYLRLYIYICIIAQNLYTPLLFSSNATSSLPSSYSKLLYFKQAH